LSLPPPHSPSSLDLESPCARDSCWWRRTPHRCLNRWCSTKAIPKHRDPDWSPNNPDQLPDLAAEGFFLLTNKGAHCHCLVNHFCPSLESVSVVVWIGLWFCPTISSDYYFP
jgi:hypothetical protein